VNPASRIIAVLAVALDRWTSLRLRAPAPFGSSSKVLWRGGGASIRMMRP
jgi:hypothetical protein